MNFYLGTHESHWLKLTDVPLFVSHRRLARYKTLPRARGRWALDSGGYTELQLHGAWLTPARTYAEAVARYGTEIGGIDFAACQDWTCDPGSLNRTGLTMTVHQQRTCDSYEALVQLAPELPWAPVLQGWTTDGYLRHADMYERRGVALAGLPVVGLGSVARQSWRRVSDHVTVLRALGLRLHGFGIKGKALAACGAGLASADSMAWSQAARREPTMPGCTHATCANCIVFAMAWRDKLVATPAALWRQVPMVI